MDSLVIAGALAMLAGFLAFFGIRTLRSARVSSPQRWPKPRRRFRWPFRKLRRYWLLLAATLLASAWIAQKSGLLRTECDIKGNISLRGERIYHLPSDEYYGATVIRPAYGERWFCSELEAMLAGWRRARR